MVNTGGKVGKTAFLESKPFYLHTAQSGIWHYAKGVCDKGNLECYFQKVVEDRDPGRNPQGCLEADAVPYGTFRRHFGPCLTFPPAIYPPTRAASYAPLIGC